MPAVWIEHTTYRLQGSLERVSGHRNTLQIRSCGTRNPSRGPAKKKKTEPANHLALQCGLFLPYANPVAIDRQNRSSGRWDLGLLLGRHHRRAATAARLPTALSQNGAAIPMRRSVCRRSHG